MSIFYHPPIPTSRFLRSLFVWAIGFAVLFLSFVVTTIIGGSLNSLLFWTLIVWVIGGLGTISWYWYLAGVRDLGKVSKTESEESRSARADIIWPDSLAGQCPKKL